MIVCSYHTLDGVPFGTSLDECKRSFGPPSKERVNRLKEAELFYEKFVMRFRPGALTLREVTLLPKCEGQLNGAKIEWNMEFFRWVCREDGSPKEHLGFVICDRLGVAMTGFHDSDTSQLAITCYSKNDWDAYLGKAKPFEL